MPTYPSRTLSVSIDRPWQEVYAYAADPRNMHHWAAGLGTDFAPDGDGWAFHDPGGNRIRLTFTPSNIYGVLDHDVFTPAGVVHSAMRVLPNGDGAEVTFLAVAAAGDDRQRVCARCGDSAAGPRDAERDTRAALTRSARLNFF
jgi:hypothetical protein